MSSPKSASERLKLRLAGQDFDFKRSLGQNFLVSDHVVEKIMEKTKSLPFQSLIEIGPGLGALTDLLRQLTSDFQVLELDRKLCEFWRNQGVKVVEGDALKWNWRQLEERESVLLVSNLPYQISSSLVIDRCFDPLSLKWMILMFQKEVAQRLTARPASADYGLLSVMAQLHFRMQKVAEASPRDFQPAPKVASRVLFFERKDTNGLDSHRLLQLLKQGFGQRRKKLVNNLKSLLAPKSRLGEFEIWLEQQGLSPQARAEELSPDQWAELVKRFAS